MRKLLRQARATGSANLAGQCLTEVPNDLLDPMEYIEEDEKACECNHICITFVFSAPVGYTNDTLLLSLQCLRGMPSHYQS